MKKWYDSDVWQLLIYILAMLLVAFLMSGCKTSYVPMEKFVYRDVVKCDTLHTSDSIFVHDSVSSSQKGDTLFVDRWHKKVVMKTQYKVRVDSFIRRDSIPVPYPVEKLLSKVGAVSVEVCDVVDGSDVRPAHHFRFNHL